MSGVTLLPKDSCPHCGKPLSAAMDSKRGMPPPKVGDVSLCFRCTGFLKFNRELKHEKLDPWEYERLPRGVRAELEAARTKISQFWVGTPEGEA